MTKIAAIIKIMMISWKKKNEAKIQEKYKIILTGILKVEEQSFLVH
jgi:hypothetical protein